MATKKKTAAPAAKKAVAKAAPKAAKTKAAAKKPAAAKARTKAAMVAAVLDDETSHENGNGASLGLQREGDRGTHPRSPHEDARHRSRRWIRARVRHHPGQGKDRCRSE